MRRVNWLATCECRSGSKCLWPLDIASHFFRHKDLLQNLGIRGNDFIKQSQGIVVEMQHKFLEYVKSARVQASQSENSNDAESEDIAIQMTADGHPIIPKVVMEKELRKADWERLLRAYLSQHYCEHRF